MQAKGIGTVDSNSDAFRFNQLKARVKQVRTVHMSSLARSRFLLHSIARSRSCSLSLSLCVCERERARAIHAYIQIYVNTHTYTWIHIYTHTYIHTCTHTYIHVICINQCVCIYTHIGLAFVIPQSGFHSVFVSCKDVYFQKIYMCKHINVYLGLAVVLPQKRHPWLGSVRRAGSPELCVIFPVCVRVSISLSICLPQSLSLSRSRVLHFRDARIHTHAIIKKHTHTSGDRCGGDGN